jgi:hypothetical protein
MAAAGGEVRGLQQFVAVRVRILAVVDAGLVRLEEAACVAGSS